MKYRKYLYIWLLAGLATIVGTSCEQQGFDPLLDTEVGAGTLTTFKAYTLDSALNVPDSLYGRVVFWEGLDGTTLVQLSVYNMPATASFPSFIMGGALVDGSSTALMPLYDVENTGEGYDFGEFATSKYYVIDDPDFFAALGTYDAHVAITRSLGDPTVICAGDIGLNATPVEEN